MAQSQTTSTEILEIDNFDSSLYLLGGRELTPPGSMRKGIGQNAIKTGTLRSRAGISQVLSGNTAMISLYSMVAGLGPTYARYSLDGAGNLYFNGSLVSLPAGITLTPGARGSFESAIPWDESDAYVFVAGAGTPFKVDIDGNVTNWGIAAPADGMVGTVTPIIDSVIDYMNTTSGWTNAGGTLTLDTSNYTQNSGTPGALKLVLGTGKSVFSLTKTNAVNLSGTSEPSLDVDIISLDIDIDQPQGVRDIVVEFDLGTGFTTDYYTISMPVANIIAANNYVQSTNDLGQVDTLVQNFLSNPQFVPTPAIKSSLMADYYAGMQNFYSNAPNSYKFAPKLKPSQKSLQSFVLALAGAIATGTSQWWTLRLPKMAFTRIGKNTTLNWANVSGYRVKLQNLSTNVNVTFWVDNMLLIGGTGLYGQYQYVTTFQNSVTGTFSNPNPTPLLISNVFRAAVTLQNIPVSTDPQVDSRIIWRTVGNGGIFFPAFTIPNNTTTTAVDAVSDFIGLNTGDSTDTESVISVVGSWSAGITATPSFALSTGPEVEVGDVLIAAMTFNSATVTAPAGWTQFIAPWTSGAIQSQLWYKVAAGGDAGGATYTWTLTSNNITGSISAFRGCNVSGSPIDVIGATATGTSNAPTAPGLTTVSQYSMLVWFAATVAPAFNGPTITQPTSFLSLANVPPNVSPWPGQATAAQNGLGAAVVVPASAGAYPASIVWQSVQFTLKPLASPTAITFGGSLGLQALTQFGTLPETTIGQCISYGATMFQCADTANPSRIYYSAVGMQEGVAGYYDLGADNTVGFGIFSNNLYLFTDSGIYLANNLTQSPQFPVWSFDQVLDIPGSISALSIVGTDIGIIYQSSDGLRLFNGYEAPLLATQILPLFRGESVEGYPPITPIIAAVLCRDEYWFTQGSPGAPMYALSLKAVTSLEDVPQWIIRDTGYNSVTALDYEEAGETLLASVVFPSAYGFIELDTYGLFNDSGLGSGVQIEWIPQCFYSGLKFEFKVQRFFVDINTNGNIITCSLLIDNNTYTHPIQINTANRQIVELSWGGISGHVIGIELQGTLSASNTAPVELFKVGIEVDKATVTS